MDYVWEAVPQNSVKCCPRPCSQPRGHGFGPRLGRCSELDARLRLPAVTPGTASIQNPDVLRGCFGFDGLAGPAAAGRGSVRLCEYRARRSRQCGRRLERCASRGRRAWNGFAFRTCCLGGRVAFTCTADRRAQSSLRPCKRIAPAIQRLYSKQAIGRSSAARGLRCKGRTRNGKASLRQGRRGIVAR